MSGLQAFGSAISPQQEPCGPRVRGVNSCQAVRSEIDDGDGAHARRTESGVFSLCLAHMPGVGCGFRKRPAGRRGGTVDAVDLGSIARKGVEVRVLSSAPALTVGRAGARGLVGRRLFCKEKIVGSNPTGSTSVL